MTAVESPRPPLAGVNAAREWLIGAHWLGGLDEPVALTFSPGDMTRYGLMVVPDAARATLPESDTSALGRGEWLVCGLPGCAGPIEPILCRPGEVGPWTWVNSCRDAYTVVVVGVLVQLLMGDDPEKVADLYGGWVGLSGVTGEDVLSRWTRLDRETAA